MNKSNLIYFADPMCSWCWGFAPVMEHILARYDKYFTFNLLLGGLRTDATDPISARVRKRMLQHWNLVQHKTGQKIRFQAAMQGNFVFNTEPASRAVVTTGHLKPGSMYPYFNKLQSAFYVENRDITKADVLMQLAREVKVPTDPFLESFFSQEMKQRTQTHFNQTREIGVQAFPSVILQKDENYILLTKGYQPFNNLQERIEKWLST